MFEPNRFILCAMALTAIPVVAQETHMVTDRMGRNVELPVEVNRIVTDFMPLPSAWYISTGSGDEVVGMHPNSMRMAKRSILGRIAPELLAAETGFTQGSSVNIEEVLRLAPDVFVTYETRQTIADVEKTGIPVLSLDVLSQSKGNVFETYFGWTKLLGQIAGQQERTDKIVAYANDVLMHTRSHIAHLSEKERPGALFFSRLGEDNLKINGTGHFGHFWMTEGGNRNLAPEGIPPLADIDMEQVYALNPEVIFISNFSPAQPEDLYENRITGQDWRHVSAVQNKRVYKVPEGIFQWYPPSADAPLVVHWIAQVSHPKLFDDYVIEEVIRDYYARFYDFNLRDEDIAAILKPTH